MCTHQSKVHTQFKSSPLIEMIDIDIDIIHVKYELWVNFLNFIREA